MTSAGRKAVYKPTLNQNEIERIIRWHERAYRNLRDNPVGHISVLGIELDIPAEVFPPTPNSDLFGTTLLEEVRPEDRVLDMGTGSGINGIIAASVAREVVGVDVNPQAVEAARANALRNGVASNTVFFESDVFDAVDGEFDLIIFDPPFLWLKPRDLLERSIADEGYETLTRFMREAQSHLTPEGRMLIFFGTSGDLGYLQQLMDENSFLAEVVASHELKTEDLTVSYFIFRLTR